MTEFMLIPIRYRGGMVRELNRRAEQWTRETAERDRHLYEENGTIVAYRDPLCNRSLEYKHVVEHAETIRLPMIITFRDAKSGAEVQVCCWNEEEGKVLASRDMRHLQDPEWHAQGSGVAWPGMWHCRMELGKTDPDDEMPF